MHGGAAGFDFFVHLLPEEGEQWVAKQLSHEFLGSQAGGRRPQLPALARKRKRVTHRACPILPGRTGQATPDHTGARAVQRGWARGKGWAVVRTARQGVRIMAGAGLAWRGTWVALRVPIQQPFNNHSTTHSTTHSTM